MIENFFRIVIGNITRYTGFTIVVVTGRAVGLAASPVFATVGRGVLNFAMLTVSVPAINATNINPT